MPVPLSPPAVTTRAVEALPPYVSNGVVGLRYPGLPHLPGTTMVNGFAGRNPDDGVEGFARAPFAIATDVQLDGVWASAAPEWVRFRRQQYDFSTGELQTTWELRSTGRPPRSSRWCSAHGPFPRSRRARSLSGSTVRPTSRSPPALIPPTFRAGRCARPASGSRAQRGGRRPAPLAPAG